MLAVVGFAGLTGCGSKVVVTPPVVAPPPPEVVVAEVPPPPPPPRLATVCDATILPDGHLKFPHEVEFEIAKANLKSTDTTNKILQCLVDFLANNKMVTKFRLEGYTDSAGDPQQNMTLSQARADSVIAWMTSHGTDGAKLWAKGYGPNKPVAPNDTPEHMAQNRRVEFHIDEIDGTHVSPDRVAAAMNPPVVVAAVAAPTVGVAVGVPTVGVAVGVPTVAVGVPVVAVGVPGVAVGGHAVGGAVGVSVPRVAVAAPSVSVGVGASVGIGGGVGVGGAAGGGKAAPGGKAPPPPAAADKDKDKKKK
jgi:outer membrane protein OmpA-like peptidoglycan-associated protein